jgi:hypothetical protein
MEISQFVNIENLKFALQFIVIPAIGYIIRQGMKIERRIRLAEFKHIATIDALQLTFRNGFKECYDKKMDELLKENKFCDKGE